MEAKTDQQLHIFFLPYMAPGHTLPLIDIAKLFALHGVKVTIITTTLNAKLVNMPIPSSKIPCLEIELLVFEFPSAEAGLPDGIETSNSATTKEMKEKFLKATSLIEPRVAKILDQHRPHFLVAEGMRRRAQELGEMARKTVAEGGSSFSQLTALIQELSSLHA